MEILNLYDLIKLIWQNRKLLRNVIVISALLSAGLSYLLPVYYKSTTTMFPARSNQLPVTETVVRRGSYSEFGETSESEQSLEFINSTRLLDKVIKKFDLFKHYEIDSSERFAYTRVMNELKDNMSSKRNKYNSIEISVLDEDPQMAADIANSITMFYDSVKFELIQTRSKDLLNSLQKNYETQRKVVDSLRIKMDSMTKYGVMSQFQRGYLLDAYAQAPSGEINKLRSLVDENIKNGEGFDILERIYEREVENLMFIKRFIVQAQSDADFDFTQKFVVDRAVPAERKYSPVRWLVVVVGVFSSILVAITMLLFRRKWPFIKNKLQD